MTSFNSTEVTGLTEADISVTDDQFNRDWGTVSTIQGPLTNQNSTSKHQFESLSSLGDYWFYRRYPQFIIYHDRSIMVIYHDTSIMMIYHDRSIMMTLS